jgi:5'-3' exoribonuclease 1
MGIPSYFSYIIRNHTGVLCKYMTMIQNQVRFERLYLDCNSILYDCYREISQTLPLNEIEEILLKTTAKKIENYIFQIKPYHIVYIAFDGVAPIAKMEQQRNRRYKSWFETSMMNQIEGKNTIDVQKTTSMFTPGTPFMNKLSDYMKEYFRGKESKLKVKTIIMAMPDEPGEGEHKLYAHMRENPTQEACSIYGLDADLMMLSICNLDYCPNMFIFRESPVFAKSILKDTNMGEILEDEPLFIDMGNLARSISSEMKCSFPDNHRMLDYVFLCFFLGNDFLPHFPSINIRTKGMDVLLEIYRNTIGNAQERFLLSKKTRNIQWKQLSNFIFELSRHEDTLWKQEHSNRNKWDKKPAMLHPKTTVKERSELFQNTPILYRKEEKYINPFDYGWENRYYSILFPENLDRKYLVKNYMEGIEWVTQYYFHGKVDWVWKYDYHYPPLLKDLRHFAGKIKDHVLPIRVTMPVSPYAQLAYVLPPIYHHLLPDVFKERCNDYKLNIPVNENGLPNLEFSWAFCRYFWECHVNLPPISTETLHKWNQICSVY